jgi:hypothetical protein
MNSYFAFLRRRLPGVALFLLAARAGAAVWQWSTPVDAGRAFLWIPPDCQQVRAVVVGQNNMIEQGILEHPILRRELAKLGIAEIFIAPPFENWQNAASNDAANVRFDALLQSLAEVSGYSELKFAPIVPLAHSAMASYPWNFAAWNPARTLAILSVHGDAPQTDRTGNGKPNASWGARNIDGIPGLMVMGEYEWSDDRLTPALQFRAEHPQMPLAMLAEPGNGHFNYCDDLIKFLAMFIRKSAEYRLPADEPMDRPPVLKPVDPTKGWLVQRWHLNQPRTIQPAPFTKYTGDPKQSFWAFDKEMAWDTQNYFAGQPGKLPQLLSITTGDLPLTKGCGEPVDLAFLPLADGATFRLKTSYMSFVPGDATHNQNAARWAYLPPGSPLGHATGGEPIVLHKIVGPVIQTGTNTFRVAFNRVSSTRDGRDNDIWLWASQAGDAKYRRIVQQAHMRIPDFEQGTPQRITFPEIPGQKAGTKSLKLGAVSDSGREVYYYVREGAAEIDGDELQFTRIPPRTKFPVKVTVVAWQLGRDGDPKLKTATPVEQTFEILN